jgi:hypothetical protein
MNKCARFFVAWSILVAGSMNATPLERSVSPSQQFVLFGADSLTRSAVSDLAESTKNNLLKLLRRTDRWKTPIVINLQEPQANVPEIPPSELHVSQTGFGLKLQLDVVLERNGAHGKLEHELLRAILLEIIYRNQPNLTAGTEYVEPPAWLLDGILASAPGRDRTSLTEILAVSDKVTPLTELVWIKPSSLDSPGRLLYRAYSFALVQLLVAEPDGRTRLGRYIDNLSRASNDPMADLARAFPGLAGTEATKAWQSQIERLKVREPHQLLTFAETEKKLEELLSSKTGLQLSEAAQRKLSRVEAVELKRLSVDLLLLATRANPVLRPTIQDYQQIATALTSGKKRKLLARLAVVESTRSKIVNRMNEIDDYLNWFEATQSHTSSGTFRNYFGAAEEQGTPHAHRRDALSVYLDAIEEQF